MIPENVKLPESRLYTFIDAERRFALYFLEGQKLIHDLALTHNVRGDGFAWFRDVVLSFQPMVGLLKHGEQFGLYIDSEQPFFRLKIEAAHGGATRCALLPEDFNEFPEAMHGMVRCQKLFPGNKAPYLSVLKVAGQPLGSIVNRVLDESYQVHSRVQLSEGSDQSAMLHQLPPLKDEYEYSEIALASRRTGLKDRLQELLGQAHTGREEIVAAFAEIGFRHLADRTIRFACSCSRERVIRSLNSLSEQDRKDLFEPHQDSLETVCEYCKARYEIHRVDLAGLNSGPN
jgi:molecular chaperone Hsp33